jgi:hypothetical protein
VTGGFAAFELYAGSVSQSFYGLRESQVLTHLDEFEDIAAGAAGKTLEDLLLDIDVQARPMVVVKRA